MERLRRYLLLANTDDDTEDWRTSVLRILLLSTLLLLLAVTLLSGLDAWSRQRYRIIGVESLFYLVAIGILWLSDRHRKISFAAFLLLLYTSGLVILLGTDDPWLQRVGPVIIYCAPLLALIFFGWIAALLAALFNILPFWLTLNLEQVSLPQLNLQLPDSTLYVNALLFVFLSCNLPLAVARMTHGLRRAKRRQAVLDAQLKHSLRMLQEQFESIGPALICAPQGEILEINEKARRLLEIADASPGKLADHLRNTSNQPPRLQADEQGQDWTLTAKKERAPRWLRISFGEPSAHSERLITLRDVTHLRQLQSDLRTQTNHAQQAQLQDALTGLLNRAGAAARLAQWQQEMPLRPIGAMGIHLDDLGYLNDTHGTEAGNNLLAGIAQQLRQAAPKDALLARIKGATFLLASPAIGDEASAFEQLQCLRGALPEALTLATGIEHRPQLNFGLAFYPRDAAEGLSLIRHCELALTQTRHSRDGCVAVYDAQRARRSHQRTDLLLRLRRALERDQLFLLFQPLVDAEGNLHSLEALVRWRDEQGNLIPPDQFIPLAEESELIVEIDQRVLEMACEHMGRWKRQYGQTPQVAINLSARDMQSADLLLRLDAALRSNGLQPSELELEITESSLLGETRQTRSNFAQLYARGFPITLDDFGTGYSSLSRLTELPIGRLKIDRAFLAGVPGNPRQETLVKSIVAMGRQMDLRLVAEGVEHHAQLHYLDELGCDSFQGYLFSPPLSVAQIEERLGRQEGPGFPPESSTSLAK